MALNAKWGKLEFHAVYEPEEGSLMLGFKPSRGLFKPKIDFSAHALHYGTSAFEGIRFYNTPKGPAIFRLKEHVERLREGMNELRMRVPITNEQIERLLIETVRHSGFKEGYLRPLIGYGSSPLGVGSKGASIFIHFQAKPWGKYLESQDTGAHVFLSTFPRKTVRPSRKIGGAYHGGTMAHLEAMDHNAEEALMLNSKGTVAEGSGENIWMVKDGVLYTPDLASEILPGITRRTIKTLAQKMNLKIVEKEIKLHELLQADEIFFTGTAAEVTPIRKITFNVENGKINVKDSDKHLVGEEEHSNIQKVVGKIPENGDFHVEFKQDPNGIARKLLKEYLKVVRRESVPDEKWYAYTSQATGTPRKLLAEIGKSLKKGGSISTYKIRTSPSVFVRNLFGRFRRKE